MARSKQAPVSRSGRFETGPAEEVARFTESISFDWRLWRQDILGSMVHATMLERIGILTRKELKAIVRALDEIGHEISAGKFQWKPELEDVHMNIEAELTRRVPCGAKLHTGRSRNDQVALDTRLWLREQIVGTIEDLERLQRALVQLGMRNQSVMIPGYTHLQRAQPVYFAHHLLAYVEMFERDMDRFASAFERTNVCPLGSGALAGSTLPLDRELVARMLGFVDREDRPLVSQNSMDAVSDRDYMVEYCASAALAAIHLSRLAEDLILWASAEFNFIRISDAFTTGSSLMPQKKNPDIAELARGKSGRMVGNLMALLTLLKGLPMTYNRDLQEDKERLFDSVDTLRSTLQVVASMLGHISVSETDCAAAANDPSLLATDLADYLVERGVPFRDAHHAIGRAVAKAEEMGMSLDHLPLHEWRAIHPDFDEEVLGLFRLDRAMARRKLTGSPGTEEVRRQLRRWQKTLSIPAGTPRRSRRTR